MVFFTADLHLGHSRLIEKGFRSFASTEGMDDTIFNNINRSAHKPDSLYIIGDFCMGGIERIKSYRERILCPQVFLLFGNHESNSPSAYTKAGFIVKEPIADIKIEGQKITLCHYAMRRWRDSHHGAWHLYGHSHGNLAEDNSLSFDVGVDCWNYEPLSFESVRRQMELRIAQGRGPEPNHSSMEL